MKREILCMGCKADFRQQFPDDNPYPGEHIKIVSGFAGFDMVCDGCGCPVGLWTECAAVSIWADRGGIPYYEWEREFISEG
jgi:hypothetical protein